MSNQLTIEVYNNIASGAPPIQVIETEISSSSIFVQPQEDVAPINVQVYESTTSGTFPIQVIESEFTGVPIYIQVQEDYAPVQSVNGKIGWVVIDKNDVGLSNVENVSILGVSGYLQDQINNISGNSGITGDFYPNSNPSGFITGVDLSSYATITNLANTGSILNSRINSLSGTLTGNYLTTTVAGNTYATITNLATTGSTLQTNINTVASNLATTGSTLQTNINTVASNLATTGSTLNTKINNLSGVSVLTFGDQNIFGTKYFGNSVYIHDLYVTGTEFIATVENNFIESPYILLNLTGGAIDGGIFFVTGVGFTGVNDYGPIIGFDHSKNFKFGVARRSDDLSILNDIASVQQITSYSGFVDGKYATIINLNNTGTNLQTNINTVATNLVTTGSILNIRINSLSGTLTGDYYPRNNPSGFITTTNFRYTPVSGSYNLLSNNRYSFNTYSASITGILPLNPEQGDEIELYDSAGTWSINPLIINNNGNYIEQKKDMLECNVNNGLIKLIYTTQNNIGWRIIPMPVHSVSLILFPSISINGGPTSGIIPLNINLTGVNLLNPIQAPVDEWYWNLNTGDENFINGQTISYTYNQTGLYNVILSGSNAVGFDIENILIDAFLPYVPNINVTSNKLSGIAPFTGQLSGTNTTEPAQFSPVDNWYWDFNNDTIFDATGQNTQVIYNTTGTYTPTAYGVNLGGTGIGNITINVVEPFIPIPSVYLSANEGYVPLTVQFSGSNLADPEFSPVNHWYWNITGDSTPEFDQPTISYTFNETGIYTFTLTAVNSAGSGTVTGTITGLSPVPTSGLLVRFNADVGVSETAGIITSWTDQQNGVIATASNGPTLLTNVFSGRNAVYFDGTNESFNGTFSTPLALNSNRTFIIIGKYNAMVGQKGLFDGASDLEAYIFHAGSSLYYNNGPQIGPVNGDFISDYFIQIINTSDGGNTVFRVDGSDRTNGTMNRPVMNGFTIGRRGNGSEYANFNMVELLVYNRSLTLAEMQQIETYANT